MIGLYSLQLSIHIWIIGWICLQFALLKCLVVFFLWGEQETLASTVEKNSGYRRLFKIQFGIFKCEGKKSRAEPIKYLFFTIIKCGIQLVLHRALVNLIHQDFINFEYNTIHKIILEACTIISIYVLLFHWLYSYVCVHLRSFYFATLASSLVDII